jgi:hypothetical protein
MNWAQLHLGLVHFPIVGAFFTLVIFAVALIYRSDLLFRTVCGLTVFCALAAAASYFSGGEAFELMKDQFDTDVVERHALVARGAFLLYTLGGAGAFVALLQELQEEPASPVLRWTLLGVNAVVFGVLLWAAHLGGLIRHPELAPPAESIATLLL